jgi:hypothetical protein
MTARGLAVDDVPVNVKLFEVRPSAEYFDDISATAAGAQTPRFAGGG